ncbi:MAG: branched-chain amino acid ABC transporter permease [Deltaproteobacteria bacterium]|nr:branched-chain amino acid ABC transporter permease [Deltaproteobacteria bacterium]
MTRLYAFLGLLLAILLALPLVLDKYVLGIFVMIFFYAYLGQAWNVLTGYTGHISLGHALYVGIGAYTSTYLAQTCGLSPWIGMFVGGLLAVIVSLFLGYLGFRFGLRGVYFVILTIAFAEIARLIVSHVKALGSFSGVFLDFNPSFVHFQFRGNVPYYYIALGFMIASVAAVRWIETSKLGKCMIAIREDEQAAQAVGVNSFKYGMYAIAVSAFMTSLAGTFYANYIFYLHPDALLGMSLSIELILRPIVGGLGTLFGPIVGSFLLTPLSEITRVYFSKGGLEGLHLILYGILSILVVLFMPKGVMSYVRRLFGGILKLDTHKTNSGSNAPVIPRKGATPPSAEREQP